MFVTLYDNTAARIEELTNKQMLKNFRRRGQQNQQKYPFPDNNLDRATIDQIPFE